MDWIPAYLYHCRSSVEVERIKTVKCRDRVYDREFERFSGVYCFTNRHVILVVVRQNMCVVPAWTDNRDTFSIETVWRKLRT